MMARFAWLCLLLVVACQPRPPAEPFEQAPVEAAAVMAPPVTVGNPPAPGFDLAGSDRRAIELADRVMERLGGRLAWDQTRYITWRFFGGRRHVWDKWTGDHRFENDGLLVLHNVHDGTGQAWREGVPITDSDSLAHHLDRAMAAWINDSYWLVMPYKLKDSGVTLRYVGEGMMDDGLPAHILDLTFTGVGRTPQNRYQIWVDIHTHLVKQWSFYRDASDTEPAFVMPWANWKPYGEIWLNDDFGRRQHSDIAVYDDLPATIFTDPGEISLPQ